MKNILFAISNLVLFLSLSVFSADWPQFKRTPDRQGCNLGESITLPGKLCAWADFGSPIQGSPAVVAGKAYCIAGNGLFARIDLATNAVDWRAHLGGVENDGSPAVGGGKVYIGTKSGSFYVLDANTGAILKQYSAGAPIFASPLLLSSGVYFGSFDSTFHALDLSGNLKWTYKAEVHIIHAAAGYGGQIVLVDGDNHMMWLTDNGTSCTQVRKLHYEGGASQGTSFLSPPMIWNGKIYVARGEVELDPYTHRLTRFDFATGAEEAVLGPQATVRTCASVDTVSGAIFAGSAYGGLEACGLWSTTSNYGIFPFGLYGTNSSPAVISNCVIFGSEQSLDTGGCAIYFYAKTSSNPDGGTKLWSYRPASGKAISSSPAVSDGRVVVGSMDGCLYGFWNGTAVSAPVTVDSLGTGMAKGALATPGQWTLSVFPNPVTGGRVTMETSGIPAGAVVFVHDISGARVAEFKVGAAGRMSWDLKDFRGHSVAAGPYFAQVRGRDGETIESFNLHVLR